MKFGERLKKQRIAMGLTQADVAQQFSITRQTVSSWENEKSYPDIDSLVKLSDYYHVSLDTLLKEDTGMRDYLKKADVKMALKPILWVLLLIDFFFTAVMIWNQYWPINNGHVLRLIIIIISMAVVFALARLRKFYNSLSIESNRPFSKKMLAAIVILMVSMGIFGLLNDDYFLIGIASGGIGMVIALVVESKNN